MIKNLEQYKKIRDVNVSKSDLIDFESDIIKHWEGGDIKAPIHLSDGNEKQLIHDYNATVFYFIQENPDISKTIKKKACIKALGRTEKWIRRVLKKKIFNEINYLRIKYFLNQRNEIDFIRRCCEIFYSSKYKTDTEIRYKIKI